jgi:hypothetical protein
MQVEKRGAALIGSCVLLFVAACVAIARNNLPYMDDHDLIALQREHGFWGPTRSVQGMWGYYRYFYTTMLAPLYWLLADHLWIARIMGLAMHLCNSFLLFRIAGNIGLSRTSQIFAFGLFLFFPFSLEAIAWPVNVTQYPLAPMMALAGAALISSPEEKNWKLALGVFLLGGSFWIHEQIGPIVILLLILCLATISQKRVPIASGVMLLIVANLALVYVTRGSNMRLSGDSAGTLNNIIAHAGYATQLIRTTPFGDFYYYQGGLAFDWRWLVGALVCAALVAWVAWKPGNSLNHRRSAYFFLMAAGAYVVSAAPILMPPIPWHTGRVIYMPFLAMTIALAFLVEIIARSHHIARFSMALLSGAAFVWEATALKAESEAFDSQVTIGATRAAALKPLVAGDLKRDGTVIIAQGWRYMDFNRPYFGEHFNGMTRSELFWSLGLPVESTPLYPYLIVSASRDRLCKLGDLLSATVVTPRDEQALRNAKNIVVAFWNGDRWVIQRDHPEPELSYLRPTTPECEPKSRPGNS